MDKDKSPEERIDSLLKNADSGNQSGSIFASLRPAPLPPSRPAPTPLARPLSPLQTPSKPAPQENDAVKMLKAKVEELEKSLREREATAPQPHPGASPPTPPGGVTPQEDRSLINFFKTRMEGLEKRLYAVQEKALASTLELKSREDAQREARKEMEDLLKAIREQQRSSELDRQSAKQLERSHARIEELEQKLLEFSTQALRSGQNNVTFQDEASVFRRKVLQTLAGQEEKQAEWQEKFLASQQEITKRFAKQEEKLTQWQEKVFAFQREIVEHFSGQEEKQAKSQEKVLSALDENRKFSEDSHKYMREIKETVLAWMEVGGVSEILEERLLKLEKAISEGDDMQPPLVSLPRQIRALRMWISDIRKELKNPSP